MSPSISPASPYSPGDWCQPVSFAPTLFPPSTGGTQPCQNGSKEESVGGQICQICQCQPKLALAYCIQHTQTYIKTHHLHWAECYIHWASNQTKICLLQDYNPLLTHVYAHRHTPTYTYKDTQPTVMLPPVTWRQWLPVWPHLPAWTTPQVLRVSVPLSTSQPISIALHECSSPAHFIFS